LALAAAVESRSAHPLAQAVVRAAARLAQAQPLDIPAAGNVSAATGRGIQAQVGGQLVQLGSARLFEETGVALPQDARQQVESLENQGKTVIVVSLDGEPVGLIAVADVLRPAAQTSIARLKALGVNKTVMLTGDNSRVAAHIASQVGLSDTRANLLPEDKLTVIRSLVQEYGIVAMVGDGVNDAPALANASVGIAMGGAGTDVALETADVALMGDDLSMLPSAVGLGRAARAVIAQNLVIALGVIAVLAVASVTGRIGIGIAVILHEGSTILVVLNSLRLLGYRFS
jgi:Cd2+/Zn2+-exporting ATPase